MQPYRKPIILLVFLMVLAAANVHGQVQNDSIPVVRDTLRAAAERTVPADTAKSKKKRSEPGRAALRSALVPGWGQIYNRKYWKLPLVYGALSIPVITFQYNNTWYNKTREAYRIKSYNDTASAPLPTDGIDPQLQPLSARSLQIYRNEFRQGMDLSILAFLVIWGLQIADAAVDAHLKSFNVSDDLSLRVKPNISPGRSSGLSFVLSFRDGKTKSAYTGF